MTAQRMAACLIAFGWLLMVCAAIWFYAYYSGVMRGMGQPGLPLKCLFATTQDCAMLQGMAGLFLPGAPYRPTLLWAGAGLCVVGAIIGMSKTSKG